MHLSTILDAAMCVCWIAAYLWALVGAVRYRHPLIPPVTQLFFCTNELSALLYFLVSGTGFTYYVAAYICWAVIEAAMFAAAVRIGFVKKKQILPHLGLLAAITLILFIATLNGKMLLICYFNAFAGVMCWLWFACKPDYPMKPIALAAFISKFIGDLVAVPVYFGNGGRFVESICVLLPVLDFSFIILYFRRRRKSRENKEVTPWADTI